MAPVAAFTMASLLFVYTRSSIQAAKRNAQRHREADGGQIDWNNENLRRHGQLERPDESVPLNKRSRDKGAEAGKRGETDLQRELRERKMRKEGS